MSAVQPRLVIPSTRRRDTLIAIVVGSVLLLCVMYGILHMSRRQESRNILTGIVVEKTFTPQHEEQVSFSGRRIEGVKQIDGEYLLKVRVDPEGVTYEVPVAKPVFETKAKGDRLEFVRPRSEQR